MKITRGQVGVWTLAVLAAVVLASPAMAAVVSFEAAGPGVGNNPLAARADFECTANELIITLTNTSLAFTEIPTELLAGLSFDIAGSPVLTPVSVFLAPGSVVLNGGITGPAVGEVSGEWAYRGDLPGLENFNFAQYGVGVNGADFIYGPNDRFGFVTLDPPDAPNGMNYGIVSAGGIGPNANMPLTVEPLIWNSVVITLAHDGSLTCDDISNVAFQYGTGLSDPFIVVPEPATVSLLLLGLAGLGIRLRRKQI